jgi:hypothetical protein
VAEKGPLCPPPLASSRRDPAEGPPDGGERGSAVVEFVLVSLLIVVLLLAVLQVAVYVHVRNVVTASAQEGARYAANADVDSGAGVGRAVEVVARATSEQTAEGLACTSTEELDGSEVNRNGRPGDLRLARCASTRPWSGRGQPYGKRRAVHLTGWTVRSAVHRTPDRRPGDSSVLLQSEVGGGPFDGQGCRCRARSTSSTARSAS